MKIKPVIAISMGDPGGVGAEVICKALALPELQEAFTPVIFGNLEILEKTRDDLDIPLKFKLIDSKADFRGLRKDTEIWVCDPISKPMAFSRGTVESTNGHASVQYIRYAADLVLQGSADALSTAPISKEAIKAAGVDFPGHTEMLADICDRKEVRMMLVGGGLQVVLQTIHVALKDVPPMLTRESISRSLQMIRNFSKMVGLDSPRIAVCGLNPHAGESGHFGTEELDVIAPAIESCREDGMILTGPLPADTIFHRALSGEFDIVLAMYHDQGLIPVKTLDFHGGVNVTVGLPIIRTSPDHGTAFNIAGKGIANEGSMVAALKYAAHLAEKKTAS